MVMPPPVPIHIVQELFFHISVCNQAGVFNNPVCQCRFAMIYMCYDAEKFLIYFLIIHNYLLLRTFNLYFIANSLPFINEIF